ncbi:sensor histidine kinase [Flavobacterium gawalongense]|uniref:Sensor histidine kinase n=2 Tax=Flavobacteriaceae TaxID=49546 RepID=A0A553BHE3_9FLAO|nr:sensor histidine kinase [Flavobacterium gawalongense]TRX04077.1 sensor histidine kinase [Flavobacterium gawalongense]TRX07678.1 sensor histidine kinase [Flavobacterium gawalongense]TRX07853.1 sensor histidine kinase [Flavobacterium gawalongense]TRX23598.1 sensor histidine kinase [Flavobacterium gawalongense]
MFSKGGVIKFNIIFWSLLFLYKWIGIGALSNEYEKYFVYSIFHIPVAFLTATLTFHIVFEKLHDTKNKVVFWSYIIAIALFFVFAKRAFSYFYFEPNYLPKDEFDENFFSIPKLLLELVSLYLMVGMYGMFYFIKHWSNQRQVLDALNREKVKSELDLLKYQVHPHFLFNMLNNIYSTAILKSPETASQILHLSNFIEYNLYHSKKELVPLNEEFDYLENFIELHKIRLGDKLNVEINLPKNSEELFIQPLLLLPLIENSIKHGVNNSIKKSWIKIEIDINEELKELSFKISNSVEEPSITNINSEKGGMGLENLKRQLKLYYPERHLLNILKEDGLYMVVLKIIY